MKTSNSSLWLLSIIFNLITVNVFTQQPVNRFVKVIVYPDHKDWVYRLNEKAVFSVQVLKNGSTIDNVTIDYETGPESMPDVTKKGVLLKNGRTEISGTMKEPGFFRVTVRADIDGKKYEGSGTAAFEPEKIQPVVKEPADFDSFWTTAITEARKVDPEPTLTLVPDRCTSAANVYHISFHNEKKGSKIYGMLAIPKKPGKYPALLKVPGGGVYRYAGDPGMAANGVIVLEIGIHGIPVNLDPQVYTDLANGALTNYYYMRSNDRNNYYFRRVYLGCIKAIDFIFTLPEFNGKDLAVTGQSQGGALSIVCAALDNRVKHIGVIYPGFCDNIRYLGKIMGPAEIETLGYYDVVNFARRIKIPGYYSWGYNDAVCHPASMYAAYNTISAAKELHIFQETGHWTFPEEMEANNNWLLKQLKGL